MAPNGVTIRSYGSSAFAADQAEVAEVAQVLRDHKARSFVYEEYSAKYDMMVQELAYSHKNVPHWRYYEAGIVALSNSIASLNQRGVDSRKGLTAGDLLIAVPLLPSWRRPTFRAQKWSLPKTVEVCCPVQIVLLLLTMHKVCNATMPCFRGNSCSNRTTAFLRCSAHALQPKSSNGWRTSNVADVS